MKENTATLAVTAGAASVARGAVAAGLRYHHQFSSSALGSRIGCSESQTLDVLKVNTKRLVLIQLCTNQVCTMENTFMMLMESVTLNSQ